MTKAEKRIAHAKAKWQRELDRLADDSAAYYNAGVHLRHQHTRVHKAYLVYQRVNQAVKK